jgi:hypothetical protein
VRLHLSHLGGASFDRELARDEWPAAGAGVTKGWECQPGSAPPCSPNFGPPGRVPAVASESAQARPRRD